MANPVADQLEKHLTTLTEHTRLDETRRQFLKRGVVQVPFLAPKAVKELLAIEVEELVTSQGAAVTSSSRQQAPQLPQIPWRLELHHRATD